MRPQRWAWAALRVNAASPALAAAYGARYGCPPSSVVEMMLTMLPGAPRLTMSATADCIVKNGPRRLVAMCASKSSGVVSSSVPRVVRPAQLTSASIRPKCAIVEATAAGVRDVAPDGERLRPEGAQLGGECLGSLQSAPGDRHVGALTSGSSGDASAQSGCAIDDKHHTVLEQRGQAHAAPLLES